MQEACRHSDPRAEEQLPDAALRACIDRCRQILGWQTTAGRAIALLSAGALVPLLVVVADHHWPGGLPGAVPATLGRVWAVSLAAGTAAIIVLGLVRRPSRLFAARLLEKLADIPHNLLVNALLLEREPAGAYAYGAAVRHAVDQIRTRPPIRWSEPGALRKPMAVAAAVLVGWLVYVAVCPKPIWPSLARFFGWELAAPTATILGLVRPPPGQPVLAGEPLEVEFAVHGRPAERVLFEILRYERPEEVAARFECRSEPGGHWLVTLATHEVSRDISFRCRANDAVVRGVIPVVPQPAIIGVEADVEPPEYTGWPATRVTGADLEVLLGTRVTFRMRANVPVRDAVFVMSEPTETRTRMTVGDPDPAVMSLDMVCTQGGTYRVEFVDQWGHAVRQPPEHRLVVRDDAPPSVEIVEPLPEAVAERPIDITKQRRLEARARDDVKLVELAFVCGQGATRARIPVEASRDADGRQAAGGIDLATLTVEPGKPAVVWFEAVDNRVLPDGRPSPQVTRSQQLTIVRPLEVAQRLGRGATTGPGRSGPDGREGEGTSAEPEPASDEGGAAEGQTAASAEGASGASGLSPATQPANGRAQDGQDRLGKEKESELEHQIRDFVNKYGQEAKDAARKLCGQPQASAETRPAAEEGTGGSEIAEPGRTEPASQPGAGHGAAAPKDRAGAEDSGAQSRGQETSAPESPAPSAGGAPPGRPPETGQQGEPLAEGVDSSGEHPSSHVIIELDGLAETVDLLELLNRGEKIDEGLLAELGWSAEKAATFVKALERLHQEVRQAGLSDSLQVLRFTLRPGREEVSVGSGLSRAASTQLDASRRREEALGRIRPEADEVVPAYLKAVLDAYYRAMAEPGPGPTSAPAGR